MLTNSFDLLDSLRFLDSPLSRDVSRSSTRLAYDYESNEDGLTLTIEMPGVKSEDLNVQVVDKEVRVKGKRKGKEFQNSYVISKLYDPATCAAALSDGILTLRFSRVETLKPKTIDVKVS